MVDPSLLIYAIGFPLLVLFLTCATCYPMKSEIPEPDRSDALARFGSDVGLDCYFVGVVAIVSATIGKYGSNVPSPIVFIMLVYVLCAVLIGRFYKMAWKNMKNYCLVAGVVALIASITYVLVILFLI